MLLSCTSFLEFLAIEHIYFGLSLETIAEIMGADIRWTVDPQRLRPSKSEVRRLLGDSAKLRGLTGWEPQYSLEQGLRETVAWFTDKENLKMYKSNIYNQ